MTDGNAGVSRRGFLRVAAGGTAATAATGAAAGQETTTGGQTTTGGSGGGQERPDLGGYLNNVSNFTGIEDMRGQDSVTIEVGAQGNGGAFAFAPAAVHIDNGTTVTFEWTGDGGAHNAVAENGEFDSGDPVSEAGTTFEHTFESDGVFNYFCSPHKSLEMKGSIVVGDEYPTTTEPLQTATPTATSGESTDTGGDGGGGGGGGGGGAPDLGGYLEDVANFSSVQDATGQDEVTVEVGVDNDGQPYGFGPAAVHISKGTTVKWEWTGEGGGHNVVAENGAFDSGSPVAQAGVNFEHTFEEGGIFNYFCSPHKSLGMKGSIVVGQPGADYPTLTPQSSGGGGGPPALPNSAKTIGIATSFVMAVTLGLAYFFMKYGGDYEPPE